MIKRILLRWLGCYLYHEATHSTHVYTFTTTYPKEH